MTDRHDIGSVSGGDKLFSGYFNDLTIHRKIFDLSAGSNTNSTSYVDLPNGSFNLESGSDAMILGITGSADMWAGADDSCYMSLQLYGTNLGSLYLRQGVMYDIGATNKYSSLVYSASEASVMVREDDTEGTARFSGFLPLKTLDATTEFKVRFKTNDVATAANINDVHLEVIYAAGFIED